MMSINKRSRSPSPAGHSSSGANAESSKAPRRSERDATKKNTEESDRKAQEAASRPAGHHISAQGRAQAPVPGEPTSPVNNTHVDKLKNDKEYKNDTTRVHFKGDRFDDSKTTSGSPLGGPHVERGSWNKEQLGVNKHLGEQLKGDSSFTPAPHSGGTHGAEVSHVRPQHAGGRTDALGAQPASWHSNVEDMAREEGMDKLRKRVGDDNVRVKSTSYVHETGEHAGTQKASRHKVYIKNDQGDWEKKSDHLQHGRRGNIDKDEAAKLKDDISNLSSSSPNVSLHGKKDDKGIPSDSSARQEHSVNPSRRNNDSTTAPYFTDTKSSDGTRRTSQEAKTHMDGLVSHGYGNIPE